jgi:hypothetical protein
MIGALALIERLAIGLLPFLRVALAGCAAFSTLLSAEPPKAGRVATAFGQTIELPSLPSARCDGCTLARLGCRGSEGHQESMIIRAAPSLAGPTGREQPPQ